MYCIIINLLENLVPLLLLTKIGYTWVAPLPGPGNEANTWARCQNYRNQIFLHRGKKQYSTLI